MKTENLKTDSDTTVPLPLPAVTPAAFRELPRRLSDAAVLLRQMGREDGARKLNEEARRLSVAALTIGIVGEFKTGKSTLANAAFLGQELLFTDLMEATCVPTEITFGEHSRLAVFPFATRFEPAGDGDGNLELRDSEQPAFVIDDPSPAEIRGETTADTPDERETKARTISRARLDLPRDGLRGLTVVDTPGLNSTNQAVVDAALRVVPACDAVLFVTSGGQLSQTEQRFLSSLVFDHGISRMLTVVNHFQNRMPLSKEGRKTTLDNLKAQLAAVGRNHVPVTMVDAQGWLDALRNGTALPEDAAGFQRDLQRFLQADVRFARLEKAEAVLQRELRSAGLELAAADETLKQTVAEREQLRQQLQQRENAVRPKLQLQAQTFVDEVRDALADFRQSVGPGLHSAVGDFVESLRRSQDLNDTQGLLRRCNDKLQPKFEQVFNMAGRQLRTDLVQASDRFEKEARGVLKGFNISALLPQTKSAEDLLPFPPALIAIADYLIFILVSPFPFFLDIILRALIGRFPEVARLLPTGLVRTAVVNKAEQRFTEQVDRVLSEIDVKRQEVIAQTQAAVDAGIDRLVSAETDPILRALERAAEPQTRWTPSQIADHRQTVQRLVAKAAPAAN